MHGMENVKLKMYLEIWFSKRWTWVFWFHV